MFVLPFVFDVYGIARHRLSPNDVLPGSLTCFIGNRHATAGLETVLVYFEKDGINAHGVSIITEKAKFKSTDAFKQSSGLSAGLENKFEEIRAKSNVFAFFWGTCNGLHVSSYRSKTTETTVPKDFLICFDMKLRIKFTVPVICMEVELLCTLKKGLYFVKRGETRDQLTVGKIISNRISIKTETTYSLKQRDISVPVCKLRPLTIMENRNENIVMVCAVEEDDTKFVMIWPDRKGSEAIELLEIQYMSTKISEASVVDLEMDLLGNITYVLEDREGMYYRASARYIMPDWQTSD